QECTAAALDSRGPLDVVVAFRDNYRWVQTFEPIPLPAPKQETLPLRRHGVYLLTGGTGKIGRVLAKYLAEHFAARLILTGRTGQPAEELKELETLGARVMAFPVDIADHKQMARVIRRAEERFGTIDGVIHAAGITRGNSFSPIKNLTREKCREQFQAKVYGLLNLAFLFRRQNLDFCWLMSSVATVLGGITFAAYASANSFMDAFVNRLNRNRGRRWLSVAWDGMDPGKTVSGFQRILAANFPNQVVVSSTGDLQERIRRWVQLESLQDQQQNLPDGEPGLTPRPHLSTSYVAPHNPVQKKIVVIWQKVLGFQEVGIRDHFFELGGDSLSAITVISRIHKQLHVEVPLTEFFSRPTIEALEKHIRQAEPGGFFPLCPPRPVEKKEFYPLASAQKRLFVLQQMELAGTAYNMPEIHILSEEIP
ncbi:MAG: SDR family NAD(P)-dependent oxidoreductase, partial [bacterium]|nr:SDR family NAD(P)-dependent oxidoreductase [bacterium]